MAFLKPDSNNESGRSFLSVLGNEKVQNAIMNRLSVAILNYTLNRQNVQHFCVYWTFV